MLFLDFSGVFYFLFFFLFGFILISHLLKLYFTNFRVQPSYVYGTPYLGGAASATTQGLVPIQATQLSHAAAIAAATNQFYEYQVN